MFKKIVLSLILCALTAPAWAHPADSIVGYYTSSSGAPVSIAYGSQNSIYIIIEPPFQGRTQYESTGLSNDGGRFSYISQDGSEILAWRNADGTIDVQNPKTGWKATWTRNR